MDPRYLTLAENLVSHSTNLTAGEKILIHAFDVPDAMVLALVSAAKQDEQSLSFKSSMLGLTVNAYLVERIFSSRMP